MENLVSVRVAASPSRPDGYSTFRCFFIGQRYPCAMPQARPYEQYHQSRHREGFSGTHVSLGGVKYAVGAVACMLLAEKIKTPEQSYLILAGISAMVGTIDTAWRDRVKRERSECREERGGR